MKKIPEGFEIAPDDHVMRTRIDIGESCTANHPTDNHGKLPPKGFEFAEQGGWGDSKVKHLYPRLYCRPIVKKPKKAIINYPDGQTISVEILMGGT